MYIVLEASDGNGAGKAFGPFDDEGSANAKVDEYSKALDKQSGGRDWNTYHWLDVLEVLTPDTFDVR